MLKTSLFHATELEGPMLFDFQTGYLRDPIILRDIRSGDDLNMKRRRDFIFSARAVLRSGTIL